MMSSRIVVRGNTAKHPVMLDTQDATVVEFHDGKGELMALFGKLGDGDNWIYANRGDKDWAAIAAQFGSEE